MKVIFLEEIDSTNKYAKEHVSEIDHKSVIYTSKQTAGRGRLQRRWNFVGGDNIYATIVLKPGVVIKEVYSNLTQYLCVILAEVFEEYNIVPKIKWPNDILVNGKKISGILAESVYEKNNLAGIVLGFGVNLNVSKSDLENINQPATSLNIETGLSINREVFLRRVLDKFFLRYDRFIEEGFLSIKDDYVRRAEFLNKTVTVRVFDKEISGVVTGIDDDGGLKLMKDNKLQVLLVGDIL